jgi:hypothetical protein
MSSFIVAPYPEGMIRSQHQGQWRHTIPVNQFAVWVMDKESRGDRDRNLDNRGKRRRFGDRFATLLPNFEMQFKCVADIAGYILNRLPCSDTARYIGSIRGIVVWGLFRDHGVFHSGFSRCGFQPA